MKVGVLQVDFELKFAKEKAMVDVELEVRFAEVDINSHLVNGGGSKHMRGSFLDISSYWSDA